MQQQATSKQPSNKPASQQINKLTNKAIDPVKSQISVLLTYSTRGSLSHHRQGMQPSRKLPHNCPQHTRKQIFAAEESKGCRNDSHGHMLRHE